MARESILVVGKTRNRKIMTNNKQQTAVEWLEQEMLKPNLSMKEILEQAKEMQKDQHIKSWEAGLMKVDFNEYYEQTYRGGEQ
jgi:uncharacterized membrane protein YebE (DUF533 family)